MEIIPSIDIRGGRCVRLFQGDYSQETVFSDDPVEVALRWQAQGATRIHIVDLDGAAGGGGETENFQIIKNLATAVWVPLQLGGGIRDMKTVNKWLQLGIQRVILGTAAVENHELVREACRLYGDAVIVGIDTRDGNVSVRGWTQDIELSAIDFARSMVDLGVKRFVHTDIGRDGTLSEPNFSSFSELASAIRRPVIASGGVASVNHLKMLSRLGAEGAIIGKALYTGDINLRQAIRELENLEA